MFLSFMLSKDFNDYTQHFIFSGFARLPFPLVRSKSRRHKLWLILRRQTEPHFYAWHCILNQDDAKKSLARFKDAVIHSIVDITWAFPNSSLLVF